MTSTRRGPSSAGKKWNRVAVAQNKAAGCTLAGTWAEGEIRAKILAEPTWTYSTTFASVFGAATHRNPTGQADLLCGIGSFPAPVRPHYGTGGELEMRNLARLLVPKKERAFFTSFLSELAGRS